MKQIIVLFIFLASCLSGCKLSKPCKDTEAVVNDFGLIISGKVVVKSSQTQEIITSQFMGLEINIEVTKYDCDGHTGGPFAARYTTDLAGNLNKQSGLTLNFTMDNTEDRLKIIFYYGGNLIEEFDRNYESIPKAGGSDITFRYQVNINWDTVNNKFGSANVIEG